MADRRSLGLAVLLAFALTQVGFTCGGPPPPSSETVVFDIDGTLSPHPLDLISVRDGAVEAVEAYLDLGYQVVLLTARWDSLFELETLAWLALHGFPVDEIQLEMSPDLLIFDGETVAFKLGRLEELTAEGKDIVYAYGDSTTDFDAYALAGIPVSEVFATSTEHDGSCEPGSSTACLLDYVDHRTDYIDLQPPAR